MKSNLEHYFLENEQQKETGIAVHDRIIAKSSPLHWHNYLELELILEGSGSQILNGEKQKLCRGCLSVIRLTDFHQVMPGNQLHLLNLMVDDRILTEEMIGKLIGAPMIFFRLDEKETSVVEKLFGLCLEENSKEEPDRIYLKHLISCIFLRILRLTSGSVSENTEHKSAIQTVLLYLHMHFRENPSLGEAANIAHYNPSHFSTTFHREVGMTYSDYLNMLKLSYGRELLLSTNLKIEEICFECGFSSRSNFFRLFKAKFGISPLQFRKN